VANAIADQKVSNTHRHAIRFDIDRMKANPTKTSFESIPKRQINATREYLSRYVRTACLYFVFPDCQS